MEGGSVEGKMPEWFPLALAKAQYDDRVMAWLKTLPWYYRWFYRWLSRRKGVNV